MRESDVSVRVIQRAGEAALVEWLNDDVPCRGVVPVAEIGDDNSVPLAVLDAAVPYGVDWENRISLSVTPERVAIELRKRGIWTMDDLRRDPQSGVAAIQAACGLDVFRLLRAAEDNEMEVRGDEQSDFSF